MQAAGDVIETDAVVVGAGPVGLFQVFELGLLDIKAHVVDSLQQAGGQCVELYADKPIYDIPAVPVCTGRELTERLLQQIRPFGARFHLGQEVSDVRRQDDGRFFVATNKGTRFITKTLIIAGGVGAFQPRLLKLDGIEAFQGQQLFYHPPEPASFAGGQTVVVGGGDEALEAALQLADAQAGKVVLVHRRDVFSAAPDTISKVQALRTTGALRFVAGQVSGFEAQGDRLTQLTVSGQDTHLLPVDKLLVYLGLSPRLGPIATWGLGLDRKHIVVDTANFQTTVPGIFAVGDIATYPGKRKLIVCGFHEATLAAFAASPHVFPDKPVLLQYTTTSPKLHKALGVASPVAD